MTSVDDVTGGRSPQNTVADAILLVQDVVLTGAEGLPRLSAADSLVVPAVFAAVCVAAAAAVNAAGELRRAGPVAFMTVCFSFVFGMSRSMVVMVVVLVMMMVV